jgi:hypothetical protein
VYAEGYTRDEGRITTLYVNNSGGMVVQLHAGVPKAHAAYGCSSGLYGYIGSRDFSVANRLLKDNGGNCCWRHSQWKRMRQSVQFGKLPVKFGLVMKVRIVEQGT